MTIATLKLQWQKATDQCYVAKVQEGVSWGVLEDAPGNWYLYPQPRKDVFGPFTIPEDAQTYAELLLHGQQPV